MTGSILIAGNSEFTLEQASEHRRMRFPREDVPVMAVKSMERMQETVTFCVN